MAGAVDLSALKQRAASGDAAEKDSAEPAGIEITEANFEDEVLLRSNQVPVVVLLWSPRSDVCLQLADSLSGLAAADNGKWSLASVNVDTAPRVAQVFGVQVVPTVVALAAGQPLSSFQGMQPADQLRRWRRRASSSGMATSPLPATRIRQSWTPIRMIAKRKVQYVRSPS
jgi:putative thioredoxin